MDSFAVGIDLGGTNIKAALVSSDGRILEWYSECTEKERGPEHVIEKVSTTAQVLMNRVPTTLCGVGVGVPGMLDAQREKVIMAPNLGWENLNLKSTLEASIGLPVVLDNDANAAAFGEAWLGAGAGMESFLLVTIGTGIGSGLVIGGEIYRGAHGMAPELGHMTIIPDGPECGCGLRGCLETLACAEALLCRGVEECSGITLNEAKDVFDYARKGSREAVRAVENTMDYLAIGLANAAVLVDPEAVIIGGGVVASSDLFLDYLREKTLRRLTAVRSLKILPASLGNKAGSLGAARLVFTKGSD